jgi:hypothetical protein
LAYLNIWHQLQPLFLDNGFQVGTGHWAARDIPAALKWLRESLK